MDTSTSGGQVLILVFAISIASGFVISLYALYTAFPRYQKLLAAEPGVYTRPHLLAE